MPFTLHIRKGLGRVLVVAAVAAVTLAFGATARAASWSPVFSPQVYSVGGGECTIKVGPVYDTAGGARWAIIGGAQVFCAHYHSLSVTVREAYASPGQYYYFVGSPNTYSSPWAWGFYDPNILQTSRICGAGYWYTQVDVSIGGVGRFTRTSTAHYAATGC